MASSAPGVDIEYPTDGPPIIRTLSTSTAAFIGQTPVKPQGSGGGVTVQSVTNAQDYLELFSTPGASFGPVAMSASDQNYVDHMGHAVRGFFANGGSEVYIASLATSEGGSARRIFGLTNADGTTNYLVTAASKGAWGNGVTIRLTQSQAAGRVDVQITSRIKTHDNQNADRIETYTAVPATPEGLGGLLSQFVRIDSTTDAPTGGSIDITPAFNAGAPNSHSVALLNGANATAPSGAAVATALTAALTELQKRGDVSLVALPGRAWVSGGTDNASYEEAIAHCEFMADRMVLVQIAKSVADFKNNGAALPLSSYMAAYFPTGIVSIPLTRELTTRQETHLIGHVAGIFARVDAWQSPAGLTADMRAVTEFTVPISRIEQGPMNDNGVNALRIVNGIQVSYGGRTRDIGGIYQYVAVRRTAFLIGDSIREALQRVVFERNIEATWQNVKTAVRGFMRSLYDSGAFQGATADEAFQVFCGLGESMTQTDIDEGKLIVRSRFKAAKPAEFIIVRVEQILQGET